MACENKAQKSESRRSRSDDNRRSVAKEDVKINPGNNQGIPLVVNQNDKHDDKATASSPICSEATLVLKATST